MSATPLQIDILNLRRDETAASEAVHYTTDRLALSDVPELRDFTLTADLAMAGNEVLATGELAATCQLECSRCLEWFDYRMLVPFQETYADNPAEEEFRMASDRVDLTPLIRTVVLLALPIRPLHDPACRGLCVACGKNLNREPHDHPPADDNNPFSVLKDKLI